MGKKDFNNSAKATYIFDLYNLYKNRGFEKCIDMAAWYSMTDKDQREIEGFLIFMFA